MTVRGGVNRSPPGSAGGDDKGLEQEGGDYSGSGSQAQVKEAVNAAVDFPDGAGQILDGDGQAIDFGF